jgi:hypothetical protein
LRNPPCKVCGERGITFGDPLGENLTSPYYYLTRCTRKVFLFYICPLSCKHGSSICKIKIPQFPAGVIWICGERGIRTPGTLLRYTRFPGVPVKPLLHLSLFQVLWNLNWRRKLQKYFYKRSCQEISPAIDLLNNTLTSFSDEYLPSKCISFVTEASEVISFPLTTPAASISRLVSYKPISTLPP